MRAKLNSAVQGVDLFIEAGGGRLVHVFVAADLLEQQFGADPNPAGWLRAVDDNRQHLEGVVRDRHADGGVIVLTSRNWPGTR